MTATLEIATAAPSAAELGPVRPSERIAEMDILRGFALLGILVLNLLAFYAPLSLRGSVAVEPFPGRLDKAVLWQRKVVELLHKEDKAEAKRAELVLEWYRRRQALPKKK